MIKYFLVGALALAGCGEYPVDISGPDIESDAMEPDAGADAGGRSRSHKLHRPHHNHGNHGGHGKNHFREDRNRD